MADLGLLGGIAQGLEKGLGSYLDTSSLLEKRRRDQQMQQADLMSKGLQINPETNEIEYSPFGKQKQEFEAQAYDPNSARAQRVSGLLKTLPGLEGTPNLAPAEVEKLSGLLGKEVSGVYGMQGRELTGQRVNDRTEVMRQGLEERRNVNSTHAGQAFEKDPILLQTKKTNNSLDRALSLLDGKEPITAKSFNVLQQDFINAMAPGGAATEGKVNREMVETAQASLNDLKLKFGDVADLRKAQPQIVNNLRNLINQVKTDYQGAQAQQASDVHDSFVNSSNPMVQKTIKEKLQRYSPEVYQQKYGGGLIQPPQTAPALNSEDQQALQWANSNPTDPRAQAIKQKLGAK